MSLADDIRGAIADIHEATIDLHVRVTLLRWRGQTYDGNADYETTYPLALVEKKTGEVMVAGTPIVTKATITFTEQLRPNGAVGRTEPVDLKDVLILPDKTRGNVVLADGFFDAGTKLSFYTTVYLG